MTKQSIQHYVSKMFIRRFMNGLYKLHALFVDTSIKGHGTLKKTFGEKGLWTNNIEQKLGVVEAEINKILQNFDIIVIDKQPKYKCTAWSINNSNEKNTIIKMALLQPKLLKDLKNRTNFEKDILNILYQTAIKRVNILTSNYL